MTALSTEMPIAVPLLRTGDRLTRAEFERRWEAMPQLKKAELIEGVVSMQAALRHDQHGEPHFFLIHWLATYSIATPGVSGGDNSSLRFDDDNEPQPDCLLRLLAERDGRSRVDEDGYLTGAPELVAEISASTSGYDLGAKLRTYARHGVQEYVVWRVEDGEVDWFELRDGRFERLEPDADGIIKSRVFPGLWLHVASLIDNEMPTVLRHLQSGLQSEEHARFCGDR